MITGKNSSDNKAGREGQIKYYRGWGHELLYKGRLNDQKSILWKDEYTKQIKMNKILKDTGEVNIIMLSIILDFYNLKEKRFPQKQIEIKSYTTEFYYHDRS